MNITKSNGTILTTIPDGIVNTTSSSLSLPGRSVAGYGEILNNNLLHSLENWASGTEPSNPIVGQLWFNTTSGKLNVKTDRGFKPLSVTYTDSNEPTNPKAGEGWWNTSTSQLFIYDASGSWVLVGPGYEKSWRETGAFPAMVKGKDNTNRLVILVKFANETRMIFSQNSEFEPFTSISGFPRIKPGINLSSDITNFAIWGTAENTYKLGGFDSGTYVRKNIDSTIDGNLTANQFAVGESSIYSEVAGSQNNLYIVNDATNSYVTFRTNVSGQNINALSIKPNGRVELALEPANPNDVPTKNYVDSMQTQTLDLVFDETNGLLGFMQANLSVVNGRIDSNVERLDNQELQITRLTTDLSNKADLVSPAFSGTPTTPTPAIGSNNLSVANTSYVKQTDDQTRLYVDSEISSLANSLSALSTANLALKANLNSPVFIGKPLLTDNPGAASDSQELTTTSWVRAHVVGALSASNSLLDLKANIDGPIFTGVPQAPTPSINSDSLQIANTAWVRDIFDVFAQNATWQGSRKFVSTRNPTSSDGENGDFWFKYQ